MSPFRFVPAPGVAGVSANGRLFMMFRIRVENAFWRAVKPTSMVGVLSVWDITWSVIYDHLDGI